jgi:hypothetical protein
MSPNVTYYAGETHFIVLNQNCALHFPLLSVMQQIKKLPSDNAFTCGKVQLYITRLTLES